MNTATRVIAAQGIRAGKKGVIRITVRSISITLLVCGLLLSAFGVIYIKDLNRRLFMRYQTFHSYLQPRKLAKRHHSLFNHIICFTYP